MGNCCCGKKCSKGKQTQPQETSPPVKTAASTAISDEDHVQTYQEFVDCLTQKSEKRQKTKKQKKTGGSFARWLERITCCKLCTKQAPEAAFWIEAPPGYLERRYADI